MLSEFTTGGVWTRIIPGSLDALIAIKATGVKLAIVSNADGSVEAQLAADGICQMGPGPGVEMDAILDSSVVKVAKPNPRIFEIALERLGGVDPSCAIHVGDTPAADCAGARAAGITPVLIDPYDDHPGFEGLCTKSLTHVAALMTTSRHV